MKKGSYFFVIDAFIAGLIILGTIVVLFAGFLNTAKPVQAYYTAEDFLLFMDSTSVRDYDSGTLRTWSSGDTINDTSRSLLEQIVYFTHIELLTEASTLANITTNGIPENIQIAIFVDGTNYFNTTDTMQDADIFFSSKRVVLLKESPNSLYPPLVVEVQTWQ